MKRGAIRMTGVALMLLLGMLGVGSAEPPVEATEMAFEQCRSATDAGASATVSTVSGVVTDAVTGLPVSGAQVGFSVRCSGNWTVAMGSKYVTTNASGTFTASVSAGTYLVRVYRAGYMYHYYDRLDCQTCGYKVATPLTLDGTSSLTLNFALRPLSVSAPYSGIITGVVTNANTGSPVDYVWVQAQSTDGLRRTGATSPSGAYEIRDLPPGSYYVKTVRNVDNLLNEAYGDVPCPFDCPATTGTPVSVTVGGTTTADFALSPGGFVAGKVTRADGGAGVGWGWIVDIFDSAGSRVTYGETDASGSYTSGIADGPGGLPSGTYYAKARNPYRVDVMAALYGGTPCFDCDPTTGTPILVSAPNAVTGIDFALSMGATIGGKVTADGVTTWTDPPRIGVFTASGKHVYDAATDATGAFSLPGLLPGSYYVAVTPKTWEALVPRVYPAVDCPNPGGFDVDLALSCRALATPVTVATGATLNGIDVHLVPGGDITGVVYDTGAKGPVPGINVTVSDANDRLVATVKTNPFFCDGHYTVADYSYGVGYGLPPGEYTVRSTPAGYRPVLSAGVPVTLTGTEPAGAALHVRPVHRPQDLNKDSKGDIVWRHSGGALYVWLMNGRSLSVGSSFLSPIDTSWQVKAIGDMNGDGTSDILWRHTGGNTYVWLMDGANLVKGVYTTASADNTWTIEGLGDFDGDGKQDILWRHSGGALYVWLMDGATVRPESAFLPPISLQWQIKGLGDFNGDGKTDILWRDTGSGSGYLWLMSGATAIGTGYLSSYADNTWTVQGVGDMDGDGKSDILWRHEGGALYVWIMDGTAVGPTSAFLPPISLQWQIQGLRDYDGDGRADVLWREQASGNTYMWFMNGAAATGVGYTSELADNSWTIQAQR